MKIRVMAWVLAAVIASSAAWGAQPGPRCPWIFLDLGAGSVIETPEPFSQRVYFVHKDGPNSDALEYVERLHAMGYTLGLIVNFPDRYLDQYVYPDGEVNPEDPTPFFHDFTSIDSEPGDHYKAARRQAKISFLKKLIRRGWQDPLHPMGQADWDRFWGRFGDRFLISPSDQLRKDRSSYLFEEAEAMAAKVGCRVIYQTPLLGELRVSRDYAIRAGGGIVPFLEGRWDGPGWYLAPERFIEYLNSPTWREAEIPGP